MKENNHKKLYVIIGTVIILAALIMGIFFYFSNNESFSSNVFLLKLTIPSGGESVSSVDIVNNKETEQLFKLSIQGVENLAFLNEKEFYLSSGETREIQINFKSNGQEVGVYLGKLIIESSSSKEEIPLLITIEDVNSVFAIIYEDIPQYRNIYPGGNFGIEIKTFDITDNFLKEAEVNYYIKNFDDEVVFLEEGKTLIVEGEYSFSKIIDIPVSFDYGDYVFVTEINYKDTKSLASYSFRVTEKEGESWTFNFFVIIIVIFIVGILGLFFYFIKTRDDLLISLKSQQNKELKKHLDLIKQSEEKIKKLENRSVRKIKIKELAKTKKIIISRIKTQQKEQRKQIKILKKKGKKDLIKKKINSWKKQGYNLPDTKKQVEKISKVHISREIKNLKKKGYATDFLKR